METIDNRLKLLDYELSNWVKLQVTQRLPNLAYKGIKYAIDQYRITLDPLLDEGLKVLQENKALSQKLVSSIELLATTLDSIYLEYDGEGDGVIASFYCERARISTAIFYALQIFFSPLVNPHEMACEALYEVCVLDLILSDDVKRILLAE